MVIRVIAIVVISFAAGVPAGFLLGMNWQANQRAAKFFEPIPMKDRHYEEMRPQW
ncbi:hypothetical protein N182_30725 [Sinorhizobium sp. GL2]|nr:hypothetical protein N182_30725 [Sinorhizobium sp. GL2]